MEDSFIKIQEWLYPFSYLYGMGVAVRNRMFDCGILKARSFDLPVISVGNITVGGTGKTPHIEYLITLLKDNYKVAVLSRGYKRKSKGFVLADAATPVNHIGDEPWQIKQKYPGVYMAVDKDRCHGIDCLRNNPATSDTELVLLDDAFQHRHVQPGMNILLVDYYRPIVEDALLPAGRLREPAKQKHRAGVVIVTKCPENLNSMDYRVITKQLNLFPYQKLYFTTFGYKALKPVFGAAGQNPKPLTQLAGYNHILLLTGIASPKQMKRDIERFNPRLSTYPFADHHHFTRQDVQQLKKRFDELEGDHNLIVTTEKDAARLKTNPYIDEALKPLIYALPIEVIFLQGQQHDFNKYILSYLAQNK